MKGFACFLSGFLLAFFLIGFGMEAWGQGREVAALHGLVGIVVDGTNIGSDTLLYGDTTYVPLRTLAEALGVEVRFHEPSRTALISTGGDMVFLENFPDIPTFESVTGVMGVSILENEANRLRFTVSKDDSSEYDFLHFVTSLEVLGFTEYRSLDTDGFPTTMVLTRDNEQVIISLAGAFYTFSILRTGI